MQHNERKLAHLVRDFLERAIIPETKHNNSLSASCQYFSTILSQEPLDLNGLQAIVDTFPANRGSQNLQIPKATPTFTKKKEDVGYYDHTQESSNGFNPSRTFGGQRSRYTTMFQPKKQETTTTQPQLTGGNVVNSKSLNSMQNIYRTFLQNQQKLEQLSQQPTAYLGK